MSVSIQTFSVYITKLFRRRLQKRADLTRQRLYINQIVENVIDDIDPRLRSISGYKKVLFPCVERILSFAEKVCSRLPGPMEFSKETHRSNSTVRSLFADHDKMVEVFSQCQAVQEFFLKNPSADYAYLVLGMNMSEKTTLGMHQQGELIIKDVLQTNVDFSDYRITHPSRDEVSLRLNLRERALHECVAQTINKLISTKNYNDKLEEDEIKLRMQLSMFNNRQKGLGPLMKGDDTLLQNIHDIKMELKKTEHRHSEISKDIGTLDAFLKKAASLLQQPAELIDVTSISFCIDHFNHKLTDNEENDQYRINLAQVTFSGNEKRVAVLAVFPRKEFKIRKPKPVFL